MSKTKSKTIWDTTLFVDRRAQISTAPNSEPTQFNPFHYNLCPLDSMYSLPPTSTSYVTAFQKVSPTLHATCPTHLTSLIQLLLYQGNKSKIFLHSSTLTNIMDMEGGF